MIMKNKRETLYKLIVDYGLDNASKISGYDIATLVNDSRYPINVEIAGDIIFQLMRESKLPGEYNGFKIFSSTIDGLVYWDKQDILNGKKELISAICTPFYDNEASIPVDTYYQIGGIDTHQGTNDDSFHSSIKCRDSFDGVEDLLTWYKHFYLPRVYEVIMEDHVPRFRELYD